MSLFKQFKTDGAKENKGVPVTFGANDDKSIPTFYISRMAKQNKTYQKTVEETFRPYQRAINNKTLADDKADSLMLDIFVKSVIVSWDNVQDADGKEITTREGITELLKALPDLYAELEASAKDITLFRSEELEQNAGN